MIELEYAFPEWLPTPAGRDLRSMLNHDQEFARTADKLTVDSDWSAVFMSVKS